MTAPADQHLDARDNPKNRPTIEEVLGAGLMIGMVVALFIQVIARFGFSSSLSWSEELARYMFIWMIYLCLGSVTLRGEHIVIDVLISRMKPRLRRIFMTIALVIAFALNVLVLWVAANIAIVFQHLGQTSAAMGMPMWLVYGALPVGMLIAALRTVQTIIRLWREDVEELSAEHPTPYDEVALLADPVLESEKSFSSHSDRIRRSRDTRSSHPSPSPSHVEEGEQ